MKKRKKKQKHIIYIVTVFLILISFSIGYSLFSTSLNVMGSAKTNNLPLGPNLNVTFIKTGNNYTTNIPSNILYKNEILNGNNIILTLTKANTSSGRYSANLNIKFTNIYSYNLSSGTISVEKESGTALDNLSGSLDKTTLTPNDIATATINFRNRNSGRTSVLKATITYIVNGITQSFDYTVIIED